MASASIDASQVTAFANRLAAASQKIEQEAESFQEEWGGKLVDEMRASVAVGDEAPHLRDMIEQVEPGGITFTDEGYYWRFLEDGTARMAPQPFVRPSMKRITPPAVKDAGERSLRLMTRR